MRLLADRKGALWDLLLYVPTVLALASVAVGLWYSEQRSVAYLLAFLASFFFLVGANRILKTRLMLLPSAPVAIDFDADCIRIVQRNGSCVDLVKALRYFADYSGRSFGLAGLNREGQRLQFVLHRAQFAGPEAYASIQERLKRLADRSG